MHLFDCDVASAEMREAWEYAGSRCHFVEFETLDGLHIKRGWDGQDPPEIIQRALGTEAQFVVARGDVENKPPAVRLYRRVRRIGWGTWLFVEVPA